ncbi:MAG: inorganic phosphate transporter [Pirellulales bacterium]|jgi:phosphate/sulfate permease|nr:inorganic phosphate transporter [Thermoguttaceae bacterium]MDD4785831.1 inorganic phosphate transporter [Pirellulales bacterium]MDI9444791.1 inorganic phosphate transporter [Planctomycetota bacterium]NLZ00423.1 inorganic phosphate transporter [Pirellulaceae bacterium]
MDHFITIITFLGLGMLVWDCVEVGRNDAANIINAVFGSRILSRRTAIWLAGAAVVLGATAATPVMETARTGIFEPGMLTLKQAIVVYVTFYLVDTVLLYSYSAFGMPVSSTACLIFSLMGASFGLSVTTRGLQGAGVVQWGTVGTVVSAILFSIVISGIAGFLAQRVFRAAIRDDSQDRESVLLHGPWIAGMMLSWLAWFMVMKGMNHVEWPLIESLRTDFIGVYGYTVVLLLLWAVCTLLVYVALILAGEWGTRRLFQGMAVLGMVCMGFAFGQNDLANCASPGLSALNLWQNARGTGEEAVEIASRIEIGHWQLFVCGLLIVLGMSTRHAQRVTRAAVNTGSQFDRVALYAPDWCQAVARGLLWFRPKGRALAPEPRLTERGKKLHYDALRASVIMAVTASVIALASSHGLPVSTTYVAFAAVVATGLADRVMARGDAEVKVGRAIWVMFSWFLTAMIAFVSTAVVANLIYFLGLVGLALALAANLSVRYVAKKRSDAQEERIHRRTRNTQWDDRDEEQGGRQLPGAPVSAGGSTDADLGDAS